MRPRLSLRLVADAVVWVGAMMIGAASLGASMIHGVAAGGIAAVVQTVLGILSGLYRGRWRLASFEEFIALSGTVTVVTVFLAVLRVGSSAIGVTVAISVLSPFVAMCAMVGIRGVRRHVHERAARRESTASSLEPVIVFGAGDGRDPTRSLDAAEPVEPLRSGSGFSMMTLANDTSECRVSLCEERADNSSTSLRN